MVDEPVERKHSNDYYLGYRAGWNRRDRKFEEAVENSGHEVDSIKVPEEPKRNESSHEICKICGTLMNLNGVCPLCNLSRKNIDEDMYKKFIRAD